MSNANMKNRASNNQNIISEIRKVEKSLKKSLEKSFKGELERGLKRTEMTLMFRVEERIEKTEENLKELIRESRDDLMTKIDSFAGKTAALEEENTVGVHQTRELDVKVDDHEKRIKQLESPAV